MSLITTAEVAERLGCDTSTVSRWVTRGLLIPVARVGGGGGGGAMLFDPDAVELLDPRSRPPETGAHGEVEPTT